MLTIVELFDKAVLAANIAAATLLGADLKAGLYTVPITPTNQSVVADLTEPNYASYARQPVVMGAPFRDPTNGIAALSAGLTWQQSGTPTPCIIYGIFYTSGAGNTLVGIEPFANPIPMNDTLDAFDTVLEWIQTNPNQGITTVIQ